MQQLTDEEKISLYCQQLGKILLEVEIYQGYSHTDVALRGRIGRDVVGKMAHGNQLIQLLSIIKICQGLDCPPGILFSMLDQLWVELFSNGKIKKYQHLRELVLKN